MHNAFKDRVIAADYAVARGPSFSAKGAANWDPQTVTRRAIPGRGPVKKRERKTETVEQYRAV